MKPALGIVIPVFNQAAHTQRCLESVAENTALPATLIVVDNASTDETPRLLQEFASRFVSQGWTFEVIRNAQNQGFGRAVNQGLRKLLEDPRLTHFVVANNDTWLMLGWDHALINVQIQGGYGMVGPYYDEGPFSREGIKDKAERFVRRNRGKTRPAWVSVVTLFSRAALEKIGLFDERFFLTCEDTDLRERFERAGILYAQTADCFIWHHSKGTRGAIEQNSEHEKRALAQFIEKWGFDPRAREAKRSARLIRRWRRIKASLGYF